jgi:hypothetical protein
MKLSTQLKSLTCVSTTGHGEARHSRRWHHFARLAVICLGFGLTPAMAIIGGSSAEWKQYPWLAMNVAMFPGQTQW